MVAYRILVSAQVLVFCPGPGQDLTGPDLDLDLDWTGLDWTGPDLDRDLSLTIFIYIFTQSFFEHHN